jgi:hypothetical protein
MAMTDTDWTPAIEEKAQQECEDRLAVRPPLHSFEEPTVEFFRWYERGGKPRPEPLTRETLGEVLKFEKATDDWISAFADVEWDRFKDRKLGGLRSPIETLQNIVREHSEQGACWDSARKAADWCRTINSPNATEIHNALNGLIAHAEHDAKTNGGTLPTWYQRAIKERDSIEPPAPMQKAVTGKMAQFLAVHSDNAAKCIKKFPALNNALKTLETMDKTCRALGFDDDKRRTVMSKVKTCVVGLVNKGQPLDSWKQTYGPEKSTVNKEPELVR